MENTNVRCSMENGFGVGAVEPSQYVVIDDDDVQVFKGVVAINYYLDFLSLMLLLLRS